MISGSPQFSEKFSYTSHPKVLPSFSAEFIHIISKMIPVVETVEHCESQRSALPDCTTTAGPEHIDRSTSDWEFQPIARAVHMPTVYRDEDGRVVIIEPPAVPLQESDSDLDLGIPRVSLMPTVYTDGCGCKVVISIAPTSWKSQDWPSDCDCEQIPTAVHMPTS